MASEKALGKRKMTFDQLQEYYVKHQKVERSGESDEEEPDYRPLVHHATHGALTLGNSKSHKPAPVVDVHPDDEHARDLLEVLHIPISDRFTVEVCDNVLFSDDLDFSGR